MLPRRAVVLLIGDLGAGKTTLAKGIVSGRGAAQPDEVSSPTFTLIHEYGQTSSNKAAQSNVTYHIDLYRLDRASQVSTLGLDELFDRDALILIEWGERFPELLPENLIRVYLNPDADDPVIRSIRITVGCNRKWIIHLVISSLERDNAIKHLCPRQKLSVIH